MIVRRVDKINPAFLLCDMKLGGWTKPQSCGKDLILSYGGGLSPSAKFLLESRSPGVSPSKADKKILFCRTEGVYLPPQLLFQTIMRLEQAPALRIKKILFPRTEEVYLPPQRSLITLIWMEQAPALRIKKILFPRTEGVYLPPQLLFQTIMRLEQAPAVREDLSPSATLSINGHAARASPSRKD